MAIFKKDFGLSLGLHVAILLACVFLIQKRAAHLTDSQPIWIEVESPPSSYRRESAEKAQQIVRTREVNNAQSPTDAAFLGERNQTADRQTVSRAGGGAGGSPQQASSKTPSRTATTDLARFGIAILPASRPSASAVGGDSAVKEYVSGIKEGEETALSTREFVFFSYFERIRGRLDLAWEPILREHLLRHYRRGRRLASEMDHKTELLVVLDSQGKVSSVQVVSESGTETLDIAAVQAFNRAGPFPHPPRGLIGVDGLVRIRWEFILKT